MRGTRRGELEREPAGEGAAETATAASELGGEDTAPSPIAVASLSGPCQATVRLIASFEAPAASLGVGVALARESGEGPAARGAARPGAAGEGAWPEPARARPAAGAATRATVSARAWRAASIASAYPGANCATRTASSETTTSGRSGCLG